MHDTNHPEQSEKRASFAVKDCALIAIATGNSAITLKEFRDALATVDIDSIYYHFWGGLLQPRFEEREYNNDFAAWSWYSLHDAPLAERLAVVDPTEFVTLEDLRRELVEIIEERFDENEYAPWLRADSPLSSSVRKSWCLTRANGPPPPGTGHFIAHCVSGLYFLPFH